MNDTVSPVPASLLSIKRQLLLQATDDHSFVMSALCACECQKIRRVNTWPHSVVLVQWFQCLWVGIGGSQTTEYTLRHT